MLLRICKGIHPLWIYFARMSWADRVRHFKEEESGVEEMCEIMQKLADDAAYENSVKIAKKLLGAGANIDLVVQGTELPREEVEAIAKRLGKLIA